MKQLLFFSMFLMLTFVSAAQDIPEFVGGQAIVRFTPEAYAGLTYESPNFPFVTTSNQAITGLFSQLGVYRIERLHPLEEHTALGESTGMNRSFVLYFPLEADVHGVISTLEEHNTVEYAHPNHLLVTSVIPNDPFYGNQWALPKIGMPDAWDIQQGVADVRIAVLDVGFKLDHVDLSSKFSSTYRRDETDIDVNYYQNQGFTLISGEDYVTPDNDPTGKGTHGTHVAGIAGAVTNNSIGIAGVGWNSVISPVRCGFVMNYGGTTYGLLETDDWIRALDWVRNNAAARVVNMSFGRPASGGPNSSEQNSINAALSANIVICASSGNSNQSSVGYPAAYSEVIAVGATNQNDVRCSPSDWGTGKGSNYGSQLSVVAPGNSIYSTYFDGSGNSTYAYASGTSMAAPHVAGAAALILSQNQSLTPAQVKGILEGSATKVPGMGGQNFHVEYGYGRINVHQALQNTPPSDVTFQFINRIEGTTNYGALVIDNDTENPVPSEGYRTFPANTSHVVRTNELPFVPNWSGTGKTEKHHRFYESVNPDFSLNHTFEARPNYPSLQDANFVETKPATITTDLLDALGTSGGSIQFRDPWRYYQDQSGNWLQSNEFIPYGAPFVINNNTLQSYGGVFLNQVPDPNDPNKPYYSVGAPNPNTIGGFESYFVNWTGHPDSVVYQNANAQQTGVVFKTSNATAVAKYKAHLASGSTAALALSSQRKIVRDHNGTYHMVYESAGHIWYTYSTNGGTTWAPEQQVSDDWFAPATNRYPTLTFQYMPTFGVVVVWETYHREWGFTDCVVRARTIGQGGITDLGYVSSDQLPETFTTSPAASVTRVSGSRDVVLVVWHNPLQEGTLGPGIRAKIKYHTGTWANREYELVQADVISSLTLAPNIYLGGGESEPGHPFHLAWATGNAIKYTTVDLADTIPYTGVVETLFSGGIDVGNVSMVDVFQQPAVAWTDNAFPNSVFFSLRSADGTRWERAASFSHCDHLATSPSLGEYYHSGTNTYFADLVWQCGDHLARVSRTLDRPMWTPIVNLGAGSTPIISAAVRTDSPTLAASLSGSGPLQAITLSQLPLPQFEQWNAGWNIAGIAVRVPDYQAGQVFPNAIFPIYKFVGQTYQQLYANSILDSNRGYWVRFPSQQAITYTGTFIDSMAMPVEAGWNMIGSISVPVDTAAVQYSSPGMRASRFFKYQNGYVVVDRLNPGLGFWVKSSQPGFMILKSGALCPTNPQPVPQDKFIITDSDGQQQELYVASAAVSPEADRIEMPPAPPEFDARWESGDYRIVVEPSGSPIELPIAINEADFPITLDWELDPATGLEYALPDSGRLGKGYVRMSGTGQVTITAPTRRLVLVAGGAGQPLPAPLPSQFALAQNHPNPFNPRTVIDYQLPVDAHVVLKVYDLLGRVVATVVDEQKPAGYHRATFDAAAVGSGVYFYRMAAGNYTAVRKMVVVK